MTRQRKTYFIQVTDPRFMIKGVKAVKGRVYEVTRVEQANLVRRGLAEVVESGQAKAFSHVPGSETAPTPKKKAAAKKKGASKAKTTDYTAEIGGDVVDLKALNREDQENIANTYGVEFNSDTLEDELIKLIQDAVK